MRTVYCLWDCHYYLQARNEEERQEMFWNSDAWFSVQGAQFTTVPGEYYLPMREGKFRIGWDQTVTLTANMNWGCYQHPNGQLKHRSGGAALALGWVDYFYINLPYDKYEFVHAPKFNFATQAISVQAKWMIENASMLGICTKSTEVTNEWKKRAGTPAQWA